ncbi:MAG: hypothetical protein CMJ48_02305 [Planctomycetaceae bacterium]|nr:hypothetical protein [Planctomycetaceae bacterium]
MIGHPWSVALADAARLVLTLPSKSPNRGTSVTRQPLSDRDCRREFRTEVWWIRPRKSIEINAAKRQETEIVPI